MKRIGSACMAAARPLWWKLLLTVAGLGAAEWVLFARVNDSMQCFGDLLQLAHFPKLFALSFGVMALFIILQNSAFRNEKSGYTLRRLPIGEWTVTLLWAVIYFFCFVILWAAQLALIYGFWRMYCSAHTVLSPGLELFVEFYAEPFLHSLLPLADVTRWLRMLFWLPALSFGLAAFGFCHRRGKFRVEPLVLLVAGQGFWGTEMASIGVDIALMLLSAALAGSSAYGMWRISYEED